MIISKRLVDGTVHCGCGTFIVANSDGWFITAAHIFDEVLQAQRDMAELSAYQATVRRIHADDSLNPKAKRKQLSRLTRKPEWIRAHSLFWGGLAASAMDLALDPLADLAVGRLEPFDGNAITEYPVFKNPDGNRQAKFIETSTPGLRGQSGGPIFDADANVWAIQSRTMSLPLGFSPVVKQGNKEIIEHQFMHVGWGSHVEEVIRMLTDRQIRFALSQ